MLFVALVTGKIGRHVGLVKVLSLVTGEAFLIHGSGFDGAALDEFCGSQSFLKGGEGFAVP